MPKSPISIDFNQDDFWQILPCTPIVSSRQAGWEGIHLEHHRQPSFTIPEHSLKQHLVCVCLQSVTMERVCEGRFHTEHLMTGSCTILPAQMKHQAHCDRTAEFVLLSLEPTLIAVEENPLELLPHFSISDPLIYQIGLALKADLQLNQSDRLYADGMAQALAVHLRRKYTIQTIAPPAGGLPKYKLKQVIDYIINHLQQEISLAHLATTAQMSSFHFARSFKQSIGVSPHQYVTQLRIDQAKQLLAERDLEIIDVSQKVGFKTQSHFTTTFHKLVGVTPKAYRNQL